MNIEFYKKSTGEVVHGDFIVYENEVWEDNGLCVESTSCAVSFECFIDECPSIGFRVTT